jgi:type IV secretory pathway VirB9-like protein
MMKYGLIVAFLLAGCATQPAPPASPPIVKIEPPKPVVPPDPFEGLPSNVRAAIQNNKTPTLQSGITTLYPYSPDVEWSIDCAPLRATELRLAPDEYTDKDSVVLGDSIRWAVRIGQHSVMVEPLGTSADPNMVTNLVISTNQRSYHLMLRLRRQYTPAIAWYYPDDVRAAASARQTALREAAAQANQAKDSPAPTQDNTQEAQR